jgi:hypothetical protein
MSLVKKKKKDDTESSLRTFDLFSVCWFGSVFTTSRRSVSRLYLDDWKQTASLSQLGRGETKRRRESYYKRLCKEEEWNVQIVRDGKVAAEAARPFCFSVC